MIAASIDEKDDIWLDLNECETHPTVDVFPTKSTDPTYMKY
jgi:hypothetical protein